MGARRAGIALASALSLCGATGCSEFDRDRILGTLGDTEARVRVAEAYAAGEGTTRNEVAAFNWFLEAAEAGSLPAQRAVATRYEVGQGVAVDEKEAASR